jgi:hypothetical protein
VHRPNYGAYPANNFHAGNRNHYHGHYYAPWPRFGGWYGYGYPGWWGYPYPYVIDPGFYDWSVPNDPASDQGSGSGYAAPGYAGAAPYGNYGPDAFQPAPEPYTEQRVPYIAERQQPSNSGSAGSFTTTPALTVIFNSGRPPEKMQNYMMTATTLTNLDQQHYEKIPLDQVNIAATQHANQSSGIAFQVPAESGN